MKKQITNQFKIATCSLLGVVSFFHFTLAQEDVANDVVNRPVVAYESGQLRDPFQTCMVKEEKKEEPVKQDASESKPGFDVNAFKVQGLIWGGRFPQAIINNKVFIVGDSLEGAEILSIDKEGITLSYAGSEVNLTAPRQNQILNTKED